MVQCTYSLIGSIELGSFYSQGMYVADCCKVALKSAELLMQTADSCFSLYIWALSGVAYVALMGLY